MLRSSGTCSAVRCTARYRVTDPLRYGIPDANQPDCPPAPYRGPGATSLPANDELVAQLHHRTVIAWVIPKVKHRVVQRNTAARLNCRDKRAGVGLHAVVQFDL